VIVTNAIAKYLLDLKQVFIKHAAL